MLKHANCWRLLFPAIVLTLTGCHPSASAVPDTLRVATFNTALSRDDPGALRSAMQSGEDAQAKLVAEVLQRTRPDIVLLQEVDHDPTGATYDAFQRNYLSVPQHGAEPIDYPYRYAPEVNTGVLSGVDLNGDGEVAVPQDAHGWGNYPGHYGMVVLSKYPIDEEAVRTFRLQRWGDVDAGTLYGFSYYSEAARQTLRLSSKTHASVPVLLPDRQPLHLLISHPTPPVFDGPEDRNGFRNAGEIAFWAEYLTAQPASTLPRWADDKGRPGTLDSEARFVVLGDLNADPNDGDSRPDAMLLLLTHPRLQPIAPTSTGGAEAAERDGGANLTHQTDPATDTADWNDTPGRGSGNLRVDYVLPSVGLSVHDCGVYWPTDDDPRAYLLEASDHRLVWVDLAVE